MIFVSPFGLGPGESEVSKIDLEVDEISASVLTYGATLRALRVPDAAGDTTNVVLGYRDLTTYRAAGGRVGATMGRFVNRIRDATFSLDGIQYELEKNYGQHSIHGGSDSFDKRNWSVIRTTDGEKECAVTLGLTSPDGDQGFPGNLSVEVQYALRPPCTLSISYLATSDRPTVINLTNHSYFNLAGEASGPIFDHEIQILADRFLPVDDDLIPTGELRPVEGTVFDLRSPRAIGAGVRSGDEQISRGCGYDHCFVLASALRSEPAAAAVLTDRTSGRSMAVATTEPGIQLHSGNVLTGRFVGFGGQNYRQSDGVCLETQHFPDWPNQPHFPQAVVTPKTPYRSSTVFEFSLPMESMR